MCGSHAWRVAWLLMLAWARGVFGQETWVARESGIATALWGVGHGNGQWIAVGDRATILGSADGVAWTRRDARIAVGTWLTSVAWGGSCWVAVGGIESEGVARPVFLTSIDGSNWTAADIGSVGPRINVVAYGNGQFLALDNTGNRWNSTDGTTWSVSPARGDGNFRRGLAYGAPFFAGSGRSLLERFIDFNPMPPSFGAGQAEALAWGRGLFMAVGTAGDAGVVHVSTDASTWSKLARTAQLSARGAAFFNNQFVVVGDPNAAGTAIATTFDGQDWTPRAAAVVLRGSLLAVAAGPDSAIAVGENGVILQSFAAAVPPAVAAQPVGGTVAGGANFAFDVSAQGSAPLRYQWTKGGRELVGATADRLILKDLSTADAGAYACRVANAHGSVTSSEAQLSLTAVPWESPVDSSFDFRPRLSSAPLAALEQPDGKIVLGGGFTFTEQGQVRRALLRVNADGALDPSFTAAQITGVVQAIAVQPDGKLLIGGNLTAVGGVPRNNLARLNADGSLDDTFVPASTGGAVSQIVLQPDGRVVLMPAVRRLTSAGAADAAWRGSVPGAAFGPGTQIGFFGSSPQRMVPLDDGRLVFASSYFLPTWTINNIVIAVGGNFSVLYTYEADGALADSSNPAYSTTRFGPTVYDMRVVGGRTIVRDAPSGYATSTGAVAGDGGSWLAGPFTVVNGIDRVHLARFTAAGAVHPFQLRTGFVDEFGGAAPPTLLRTLHDESVLVAGNFARVDGIVRRQVARIRPESVKRGLVAPSIVSVAPLYQEVRVGERFTIRATATGSPVPKLSLDGTTAPAGTEIVEMVAAGFEGVKLFSLTATSSVGTSMRNFAVRAVRTAPFIIEQPVAVETNSGRFFSLTAATGGSTDLKYQWFKDDVALPGATRATYTPFRVVQSLIPGTPISTTTVQPIPCAMEDRGNYRVVIANDLGTVTSATVRVAVDETARFANLSTRAQVRPGDPLIVGFVIRGPGSKQMLVRGIGPGLATFRVPGALVDPALRIFDSAGSSLVASDDWVGNGGQTSPDYVASRVGAFPLSTGSSDAAVVVSLPPGAYTAVISGKLEASGVVLAELYDADDQSARITNLSARGFVGLDGSVMIPAFVAGGATAPKRLLIRGVGPGLAAFGVANALGDPVLSVVALDGRVVATNDNWEQATNLADLREATSRLTFPLTAGAKDAALLLTLPAGNYTCLVSGAGGTSGTALVEVYEVP